MRALNYMYGFVFGIRPAVYRLHRRPLTFILATAPSTNPECHYESVCHGVGRGVHAASVENGSREMRSVASANVAVACVGGAGSYFRELM